ncbi:MAG TPA: ABC transporter transmembrane domain-containing protein, partial [Gemmatimonadales bacterium]|nr:ABC transporter transmembrane domain-containing protein [Gemmatimonadales bacterium]
MTNPHGRIDIPRGLSRPGKLVRLWPRVRPYRGALAVALVALLLSGAITLAFPKIGGALLDAAFQAHDRSLLDRIALGLFLLFVLQAGLNYVQTYFLTATGEKAVAGLRRELFGKLLELPPGFFADRRTGELMSRLSADVAMLQGAMSTQIAELARQVLQLVGSLVLLTISQPRLTLTALAVAPLVIGTAVYFGRRLRKMSTGLQDQVAEANGLAEEALGQIRTVQSFVQEPAELGRYGSKIENTVRTALRRAHTRGIFFG